MPRNVLQSKVETQLHKNPPKIDIKMSEKGKKLKRKDVSAKKLRVQQKADKTSLPEESPRKKQKVKKQRAATEVSDIEVPSEIPKKKKKKKLGLSLPKPEETPVHSGSAAPRNERKDSENSDSTLTINVKSKKRKRAEGTEPAKRFRYSDKEVYRQGNMEELEQLIEKYKAKGLAPHVAQHIRQKWEKREARRIRRQTEKRVNKICFGCRKFGHELGSCPERKQNSTFSSGICFKCGSTEHRISGCSAKVKGFPYATCFVCGKRGHLSRDCNDNPNGVYPDGGTCKECGLRDHLVKDCPTLAKKRDNANSTKLGRYRKDKHVSADDDDNVLLESDVVKPLKKKPKVISF